MKIAVIYICTGPYGIFWNGFYTSAVKYFLPGFEKHFFVFTDNEGIAGPDITVIHRKSSGFPMDSLLRFEMFCSLKESLREFDMVFYFNSNMVFLNDVNEEIIPSHGKTLVGLVHPGYYSKSPVWFPYERNRNSKAMIRAKRGRMRYYAGGLIGGTKRDFIQLSETCSDWVRCDLSEGIIARFHDESHLNRYMAGRDIHELDPGFAYPEGWHIPFVPKILLIDKVKAGGDYFRKQKQYPLPSRIIRKILRLIDGAIWYCFRREPV